MSAFLEESESFDRNYLHLLRACCISELYKNEIFKAIVANDINKVKELLASKNCLSARHNNGYTPLHVAIVTNNKEILDILIQQEGIDLDALGHANDSPLILCLDLKREEDFILKLIDANCNVNICNVMRESALHIAAKNGYVIVGEALIKKGANLNSRDTVGFTPLHEACCNSHLEFVQLLLRYDADTSVTCDLLLTPFMVAVDYSNDPRVAYELLERESCLNNITSDGYNTLLLAIRSTNPIAFDLIKRGADVNCIPLDGQSALELALFWKDSKLYNAVFPKFNKDSLTYEFLRSFFIKCRFPGEEWGLCAIDLLNCHDSSHLFRNYFKRNPNDWTLCSIKGIPAKMRAEIIERFLSLQIPIRIQTALDVYRTYGFREEMEAVLQRHVPYLSGSGRVSFQYMATYSPIFYGTVFIAEDLKKLVIDYVNSARDIYVSESYATLVKFVNLNELQVPSLVELSRDACRNLLKMRCHYRGDSSIYHRMLNSLLIPQRVKDIIKLKIPIYS